MKQPVDPETELPILYIHEEDASEIAPEPHLAPDWAAGKLLIAVAPRPIFGTWNYRPEGKGFLWAAVLKDDPDFEMTVKNWREFKSEIVLPISERKIWSRIVSDYREKAETQEEFNDILNALREDEGAVRQAANMRRLPPPKHGFPEDL